MSKKCITFALEILKQYMNMEKKDRELLVKDLSSRLSYNVICSVSDGVVNRIYVLSSISKNGCGFDDNGAFYGFNSFVIKPYLRSMEDMTEEERGEYDNLLDVMYYNDFNNHIIQIDKYFDWLNAHHFDYHCLIEKGLAIRVTDDNNPYSI